jgi:hypothetical protein
MFSIISPKKQTNKHGKKQRKKERKRYCNMTPESRNSGGKKREQSDWGYNWTTLFLGDINTGTWPARLGESRI